MHTIKQIIDNQSEFKEEIVTFLKQDLSQSLKVLKEIETDDEKIKEPLDDLRKKVKKMKTPSVHTLFYLNKKRNLKYYAWWDADSQEANVYKYA